LIYLRTANNIINFTGFKNNNLLPDPANELNTSNSGFRDEQLIELESVDSTNNYAMALLHEGLSRHGMVYLAHEQVAGKGQRGRTWTSAKGENISMSLVIDTGFLDMSQQFLLSAAVALGCHDLLSLRDGESWKIKWPNDLYWRDRKAAGILIESLSKGNAWLFAVAGVGINVNQTGFPPELANPVSLKQITGEDFRIVDLAKEFCQAIFKRVFLLRNDPGRILAEYNEHLFKKNQPVRLRKETAVFESTLRSVNAFGQLITTDRFERIFSLGEVQFIW
jgi:BirA family transcriptional regulator, biotin operon repressor / biotin---[acetyl-CoA-carboxylase] ligase